MPSPLKICIVPSRNVKSHYADVCSAFKENGHHVRVWEARTQDTTEVSAEERKIVVEKRMGGMIYASPLIRNEDLSKATMEASWADMLLLVGFGRDACFLAGVAHVSGVRTVVLDTFPFAWKNSLPAQSISYWCDTLEDVVILANNWEDPIPNLLEENS